eukprot:250226_1
MLKCIESICGAKDNPRHTNIENSLQAGKKKRPPKAQSDQHTKMSSSLLANEPELDVDNIQGDILLGFNKPHQLLITLDFNIDTNDNNEEKQQQNPNTNDSIITHIKHWLKDKVLPKVTTCYDILSERKRFRQSRQISDKVFFGISFGFDALLKLCENTTIETELISNLSKYSAYAVGANMRSTLIGDPIDKNELGSKASWQFGQNKNPDLLINLASDKLENINKFKHQLLNEAITKHKLFHILNETIGDRDEKKSGLYGHEAFGFKDGLSQPECRGKYKLKNKNDEYDFIVKRQLATSDPRYNNYSRPGFRLLEPGNFLLGYNNNDGKINNYPQFLKGSSYIVYRKFNQNVPLFWNECFNQALDVIKNSNDIIENTLENQIYVTGQIAAKMVGRWWDGTPLFNEPRNKQYIPPNNSKEKRIKKKDINDEKTMLIDAKQNGFNFNLPEKPWLMTNNKTGKEFSLDSTFKTNDNESFPADNLTENVSNVYCPFASHIRKINPRDDTTDIGLPKETLKHRIIRRGINFGERIKDIFDVNDKQQRGLLFICYQNSIENGFEFIQKTWSNSNIKPITSEINNSVSDDMITGQRKSENKQFKFQLNFKG